ncbi:hypothetical protein LSO07_04480 [Janthinobacterium sp. PLB04]|uniref:Uncharacterized protein n=1 Tax=Janthinobacterium lividum TaxID=29581 RepID=A0AAJ4MU41_9BURK|nr:MULTISPECIES: hypothetical protein [Janthinobacterium]KAB0331003.1 hypothetical protein F3B38_04450 [Janthinobacterium lividum]QSX97215.1 hypothetical protein J3P46_04480 [Janthinobacterium lividum]UGQ37139.1 hypothetical protein LSO07_04480 [Janthinobacterium sp. PLB04]
MMVLARWEVVYFLGWSELRCAFSGTETVDSVEGADARKAADGTIVLELGHVRGRIEGQPNTAALVQVLDRVLR